MDQQADFLDLLPFIPKPRERQIPRFEDMDWKEEARRLLALRTRHEAGTTHAATACHQLPPESPSCLQQSR